MRHLLIPALLSTLCLGGCGEHSSPASQRKSKQAIARLDSQSIRINIVSEPQTLDSRKARTLQNINLMNLFQEGLFRIDQSGEPQPALAESFTVSEDGLVYTFNLRNAKWTNGESISSEDFVYTWKQTLAKEFPSDNAFLLFPIKNARAIKTGNLPISMLGAYADSPKVLRIELEKPTPFFTKLLTQPIYFPICAKNDRENPNWALDPKDVASSGPFVIERWDHQNEMILKKNPHYWDAKNVTLEQIEMMMIDSETGYKLFESGELDWEGSPFSYIPTDVQEHLKQKTTLESSHVLGSYWIRVNTTKPHLSNVNLRKALAYAINRRELVDHVMCGDQIPQTGIVPVTMNLQRAPFFCDGDVRLAKNYLEKLGVSKRALKHLTMIYPNTMRNHQLAQSIQDQWLQGLGINVQLEPLDPKIYTDRLSKGSYDLAYGDWVADFDDPINFLEVFKTKIISTNHTGWESPNYFKAIETSYLQSNPKERTESLQACEKELIEDMPVIPLFQTTMTHVQDPRLKDVVVTSLGRVDFKWAYVADEQS